MPWFRPSCQIDAESKSWIDRRFTWLSEEFGLESIWEAEVVLPTHEYFPDPYDGSEEAAESLFDRVCGYMHVDRERTDLCFYSEGRPLLGRYEGTAGLYEPGWRQTISIESSNLDDPTALVAAMAHELGHVHLLGDGHISRDAPDHEPLTDLLTVYFGMGIFTANSVIRERTWRGEGIKGWSIGKQGYLTAPMYGYAFALFAWARGEHAPAWVKHLRLDVRSPFKKDLRYLIATKDSDFKPSLRT